MKAILATAAAAAALAGAAGEMMLHAVSVKDLGFTAVQLHRHRVRQGLIGRAAPAARQG